MANRSAWKRVGSGLLALIAVAATAAGGWYLTQKPAAHAAAPVASAPPAVDVEVYKVQSDTIPVELRYLGQTVAAQQIEIRARIAGFLEARLFEEGHEVKKGDLLFKLERTALETELRSAQANLAQVQARLDQANRQVVRFTSLVAKDAAAVRELDDWLTSQAIAQADLKVAQAKIEKVQLDLSYTQVFAPLSGIIGRAAKDVGSYLEPMNPSVDSLLATLQQIDPIYVQFSIGEKDLLRWQALNTANKSLRVRTLLADDSTYGPQGVINFVDVRLDPSTGTALARATLANPQGQLRPGQFLRVMIEGLEEKNVLAVPQQAVIQSPAGAMVYRIGTQGQAEARPVMLGAWTADRWIVAKGLEIGDQIILDRLMQLRPGSLVKARP